MDSRPRKLPLEQGCGRLWAGAASYGLPNRAPKYGLNRWSIRLRGQSINTLTVEPRHDLCFDGESTRKFWLQNRGHSGCRYIYIPSYTNHGSGWHGPWKDRVPLQSGGELHFHVSESECISYSNPMGSVLVLSNSGDLPPTEAPNHSNHSNHKPSR